MAAAVNEVFPADYFGFDEAFFEVCVNDAGGFGGEAMARNGPSAGFFGAGGEVGHEAEGVVGGANEAGESAVGNLEFAEEFGGFFGRKFA